MAEKLIQLCPSRCKPLVFENVTYRSAYDFEITAQDQEKACRELNEKEDERESNIQKLKERLNKVSEFRYCDDDYYLLCYLRFRKFRIDDAYNTIRNVHSKRLQFPELFSLPPNLKEMCDLDVFNFLPYRDKEGRFVYWMNFGKWNPGNVSIYEVTQLGAAMLDVVSLNPCLQIHGFVGIWDFKGFSLTARQAAPLLNPRLVWASSSLMQDCFPGRVKLVLLINCYSWVRKILNAMKYFLKKKIRERIIVLGDDVSELYQFLSPAILPKELGGTLENEECKITDYILENLPYLQYIHSFGTKSGS